MTLVYFKHVGLRELGILDAVVRQFLSPIARRTDIIVPIFRDQESSEVFSAMVSKKYEHIFGREQGELNTHNYNNLLKNYFLSVHYYPPLLLKDAKVKLVLSFSSRVRSGSQ